MSNPTAPKQPETDKPEPPPIVATLNHVAEFLAERDRLAAEGLVAMFWTCEGR